MSNAFALSTRLITVILKLEFDAKQDRYDELHGKPARNGLSRWWTVKGEEIGVSITRNRSKVS
jgi:hypothetical protein